MYKVTTIGDLSGGLSGQDWPTIPPGWVPAGTPGLPGVPAPVPGPPRPAPTAATLDGPVILAVALGSVAAACVSVWAWSRWSKGKRR
jgi:hypothetical protein